MFGVLSIWLYLPRKIIYHFEMLVTHFSPSQINVFGSIMNRYCLNLLKWWRTLLPLSVLLCTCRFCKKCFKDLNLVTNLPSWQTLKKNYVDLVTLLTHILFKVRIYLFIYFLSNCVSTAISSFITLNIQMFLLLYIIILFIAFTFRFELLHVLLVCKFCRVLGRNLLCNYKQLATLYFKLFLSRNSRHRFH